MIRVTIDLLPGGREEDARTLHVIEIWNDLVTSLRTQGKKGSYRYRISRKMGPHNPNRKGEVRWHKDGEIVGFPRASKNAVHLLRAVLNEAYYGAEDDQPDYGVLGHALEDVEPDEVANLPEPSQDDAPTCDRYCDPQTGVHAPWCERNI